MRISPREPIRETHSQPYNPDRDEDVIKARLKRHTQYRSLTNPLVSVTGMIEAAARLREETRPRVMVAVKIEYTRQVTRFGFSEVRTSSGAVLWRSRLTGTVTKGRPRYVEVLPAQIARCHLCRDYARCSPCFRRNFDDSRPDSRSEERVKKYVSFNCKVSPTFATALRRIRVQSCSRSSCKQANEQCFSII